MKRFYLLTFIFLCMVSFSNVSAQRTYIVNFSQSDFTIGIRNSKLYIQPSEQIYLEAGDSLSPAIPYIPYRILIPNNIDSIEYQAFYNQSVLYTNKSIEANTAFKPTNMMSTLDYDIPSATKSSSGPVIFEGIRTLDGNKFACFKISPFIYTHSNGGLYFSSSIVLYMSNLPEDDDFYAFSPYEATNPLKTPFYNNLFNLSNFQEYSTVAHRNYYNYLIITSNALVPSIAPLVRWKSTKGLRVALMTKENIAQNFSGRSMLEKIKKCIAYYYNTHKVKYVVLGGDATVIPAKMIQIHCGGNSGITPCDLFFACLNGPLDWDGNDNGVPGEPGDSIDLVPQVSLTRIPAGTASEMTAFVDKIISYETNPTAENYVQNFLNVGSRALGINWNLDSNFDDSRYYLNYIYSQYISPLWDGNKYWYYQGDCNLIDNDQYAYVDERGVFEEIEKGYHFVHEYSHGSDNAWSLDGGSTYSIEDAEMQRNEESSIFVTNACHTNAFDQSTCLSKSLLNNPDGGGLAYFGSSREGWGKRNGVVAYSLLMDALFFKHLFMGDPIKTHSFGSIARQAKLDLAGEADTWDNPYRWLQFSVNAMGDAEMPIYTEDPQTFTNVNIQKVGTTVMVNTGGVDSCTIAITSASDYGATYMSVARNTSSHTFYNVCDDFNICVTHHNYIPLVYYSYSPSLFMAPEMAVNVNEGLITVNLQFQNGGYTSMEEWLQREHPWLVIRDVVSGDMVYKTPFDTGTIQVDTNGWQKGLYAIMVNGENPPLPQKIMVR